jgi:hypothetical protein
LKDVAIFISCFCKHCTSRDKIRRHLFLFFGLYSANCKVQNKCKNFEKKAPYKQFCGAEAARSCIILVEPELQRDAALAATKNEKVAPTLRLTFVCFKKIGLLYSRVGAGAAGAGAASKFFHEAVPFWSDPDV